MLGHIFLIVIATSMNLPLAMRICRRPCIGRPSILHILSRGEELSRLQIVPSLSLQADYLISQSAMHHAVHGSCLREHIPVGICFSFTGMFTTFRRFVTLLVHLHRPIAGTTLSSVPPCAACAARVVFEIRLMYGENGVWNMGKWVG